MIAHRFVAARVRRWACRRIFRGHKLQTSLWDYPNRVTPFCVRCGFEDDTVQPISTFLINYYGVDE